MKYYDNGIYPIALVLSNDIESVRKEYLFYNDEYDEEHLINQVLQRLLHT